jgi:hypothetical protein
MTPLEFFDIEASEFSSLRVDIKQYFITLAYAEKHYEWYCLITEDGNEDEKNRANALYAAYLVSKNPKHSASSNSSSDLYLKKKVIDKSTFEFAEKSGSKSSSATYYSDDNYYLTEYKKLVSKCGFGSASYNRLAIYAIKR